MTRSLVCPNCGAVLEIVKEPNKDRIGIHKPDCPFCASGPNHHTQMIICNNWGERWDAESAVGNYWDATEKLRVFGERKYLPEDKPAGGV